VLRRRDPQAVAGLHRDLTGDVRAAEGLVLRQPGRGVTVALLIVRRAACGEQVEGIVGERRPLLRRERLRALLPRVAEGDDMVDLHQLRSALAADEGDRRAGVRIVERARGDPAAAVTNGVGELNTEDVVAGVASVVVDVLPARAELRPVVAGLRGAALDRESGEQIEGSAWCRGGRRGGG